MSTADRPDQLSIHRVAHVIDAVARRVGLRANLFIAPQNTRDAKGTQARYAVWWVAYHRLGMTQGEIAGMFRISDAGIGIGIARAFELAPDGLHICQALEAAEKGAASAARKWPLTPAEAERVARLAGRDWREPQPLS